MKATNTIYHWAPRLLGTAAILFIAMFATDAIKPGAPFLQNALHLLMHLIPAGMLALLFAFACRWERVGGWLLLSLGVVLSPAVFWLNYHRNQFTVANSLLVVLIITVPLIFTGILFLLSSRKKQRITHA